MKNTFIIILTMAALAVSLIAKEGKPTGIAGALGGGDDKPKRGDKKELAPTPGLIREGRPVRPGKPSGDTGKPTVDKKRTRLEAIMEEKKLYLEDAIKNAEAGEPPEKFKRVSDAERRLKFLESQLREMEEQLDLGDREAAAEMRNADDAFNEKWKDVIESIDKGLVPEGVTGEQWAKALDEYERAKAVQEAKRAGLGYQLQRKREGQLKDLKDMIEKAKTTLQRIKDSWNDGDAAFRRVRKKLLEKQAHEARLALWKKQLAELKQIQAEARGEKSSRSDNLMQDVYRTSPMWYVDELRRVVREMSIQFATKPITKKQQGLVPLPEAGGSGSAGGSEADDSDDTEEEGLPLPEWLIENPSDKEKKKEGFDRKTWDKAKFEAQIRQLEDANRRLLVLDGTVKAEDEEELRDLRRSLESRDSIYGDEKYKNRQAEREAKIEKRRMELEESRKSRNEERRKGLESHIEHVKNKISKTKGE